jgi:hypothetical protein
VLDARHPGTTPAGMPATTPVSGHPGVFELARRNLVARRVFDAWLLVEGGRDLQQRLSLLADLQGSVHLGPGAIYPSRSLKHAKR